MTLLRYSADRRSVLFIATSLALMAVQWTETLRHPTIYAASLAFAFFACVINHNHQHHPTFRHRRLDQLFGLMITWATGQPSLAIRPMHMMNHHVHNNDEEDFVRASIVDYKIKIFNLLLFPFVALRRFVRVKAAEMRRWREKRPELYRQLVVERWALYPLLVVLLFAAPRETFLFIFLPWLFGQWGILAVNHIQHAGCDHESRFNHSRNFTGSWLNWWTFNNGFHTAHHLQPGLHWTRLPVFHKGILPQLAPELQEPSLLRALARLYFKESTSGPDPRSVEARKTS